MPTYVPKFRQHVIVLRIRPFVIKKTSTQQGPKTRCPKGPLHHPFYYRLGMTKLKLKKVDWVLGIYPITLSVGERRRITYFGVKRFLISRSSVPGVEPITLTGKGGQTVFTMKSRNRR